ncbi:unnamed protein product [Withania somnifera]
MANKKCFVTFVICICMLVNLCYANENFDSSFETATTQADKGLDWWHSWFRFHPWFRFQPHPWPFVHPPMPLVIFVTDFLIHGPSCIHQNLLHPKERKMMKGLDWWYPWFGFHPWFRFHPRPSPFVHPPMPVGGFPHRFPHPWPFMHPPKPSSSEEEKN